MGHVCLHVYILYDESYLHAFIRHKSLYLYCNLSAFVWKFSHSFLSVIFLVRPLSHRFFFFSSLTSCLHVFFAADVLTDKVIALEADAWTQDDIALDHELMLKLGRISGIHPYTSHLIIQGGGETCL